MKVFTTDNPLMLPPTGKLYGKKEYVEERHRHRYEVNPEYVKDLEANGMKFVGHSTDGQRMEIMELQGMTFLSLTITPDFMLSILYSLRPSLFRWSAVPSRVPHKTHETFSPLPGPNSGFLWQTEKLHSTGMPAVSTG